MLAILKKFSIAVLAGGLVAGVLVPGSVANAESDAVVGVTDEQGSGTSDPVPNPSKEATAPPAAPAEGEDAEQPPTAESVDLDPTTSSDTLETPAAPPTSEGDNSDGDDVAPEGLDEKLAQAALEARPMARASAAAQANGFRAGYIISDKKFYNGKAMSTSDVQKFLNQQLSGRCTIGQPGRIAGGPAIVGGRNVGIVADKCLNEKTFTSSSMSADAYCGAYQGSKTPESAATIIARVAQSCGISPQVLLVRLQLEQSLISDTWPTVRQYDYATGSDCPDSGPGGSANCNPAYKGFAKQVYRGAWHLKRYTAQNGLNYNPGRYNTIKWNPKDACGTSQVYIQNVATATLYTYTPYRPNQAALNAGWGEGDGCSSYGNRNFYLYYTQWFGSPTTFFSDVPESRQFYKEIEWMGTEGLSTGFQTYDGRGVVYEPTISVSREAMAAFLYRLEKAKFSPPKVSPFADVSPSDKFYRQITWMHAKGYSTGTKQPSGKPIFAPKDPVSRGAMAAFLYRFEGAKYAAPKVSPFADIKPGSKFYREITWMHKMRYSTGNKQPSGKPKYLPYDNVSRGAMAAFIYRMEH
ncbi:hypothetical protein G7066_13435 [Leucobacter coleopterorum]|uniref:SLH domain-containing protein n=1 Tax=Leucobacter coleopterorum TaxID=2714933 RepID=A0ABX6K2R3_9MICO|nr:S-layer homology domain-containing protein [Leucobacter coleopterorum]QIM19325.1 hypothetical protein G7066_13435 [Leucobacter coleopterorum]